MLIMNIGEFWKFCVVFGTNLSLLGFKDEDESSSLFLRIFGFDSVLVEREIVIVFLVSWQEVNGVDPLTVMCQLFIADAVMPGPIE
jgi:hypothetical protein